MIYSDGLLLFVNEFIDKSENEVEKGNRYMCTTVNHPHGFERSERSRRDTGTETMWMLRIFKAIADHSMDLHSFLYRHSPTLSRNWRGFSRIKSFSSHFLFKVQ